MSEENFAIDLKGEDLANVRPNEGGGFFRLPIGDYRFKITDVAQKAKEGDKPHVMLKVTLTVIAALNAENSAAVGASVDNYYAGSRQSPKYMQERLACLIRAAGITLAQGQPLSRSMLIGRELDATCTWELSKPTMDATTGETKKYVNHRVIGERPAGTARSGKINPEIDSREAIKYLEDMYGETTEVVDTEAAPWAQSAGQPQAQAQAQPEAQTQGAPSFRPEAEADPTVMQYRAYIRLETPHAPAAREALVGAGFDPDGPVNADVLPEPLKGQYVAKFPPQAGGGNGLPGLPGLPPPGGAAPKGKRAPKSA